MSTADQQLKSRFVAWMEERRRALSAAARRGHNLVSDRPGHLSRAVSPIGLGDRRQIFWGEPVLDRVGEELAEGLYELTKATLKHFPVSSLGFHMAGYEEVRAHLAHPDLLPDLPLGLGDVRDAIAESDRYWSLLLVWACLEKYLASVADLAVSNEPLAINLVDELLEYARSPSMRYQCLVPVVGIEVGQPVVSARISVRGSDPQDEAPLTPPGTIRRLSDQPSPFPLAEPLLPWIIEVSEDVAKGRDHSLVRTMEDLLLSFQLAGYPLASRDGSGAVVTKVRWLPVECATPHFDAVMNYTLPQNHSVDDVGLQHVLDVHRRVQQHDETTTLRDFALGRFVSGLRRQTAADTLVDYVNALECVLLPGGNANELRFRFAANGAAFTRPPGPERLARYQELLGIYDDRSSAVHRPKSGSAKSINKVAWTRIAMHDDIREMTRDILLEAVMRDTWPGDQDLVKMLFNP